LSADPLGIAGGLNLYEYAAGNPMMFIDFTGLCPSGGKAWYESAWDWTKSTASTTWQYAKALDEGFNYGWNAGTEILLNNATLGYSDKKGWTESSQYQGGVYEFSRWSSGIGVGAGALAGGFYLMGYNPVLWGGAGTLAEGAVDMAQNAGNVANTSTVWNPINGPGPLGAEKAATFRSATYTETVLSEPLTLYRSYGGNAPQIGPYWTRTAPQGALQATMDSAILPQWGNTMQSTTKMVVPKGTVIYEGVAAPQGLLHGGGNQVVIPKVDPSWIVK
jgi:hypothetical protein